MKTFVRLDVFKTRDEADQQEQAQNAIPGQQARVEQFGVAIWNSRLGTGADEVAFNSPFEQGVFVVITEGE